MNESLRNLNSLFDGSRKHIIFLPWGELPAIDQEILHQSVCQMVTKLAERPEQRWLLHSTDLLNFTTGMLALLAMNRELVICAGNQPSLLEKIAPSFDALLTDEKVSVEKPVVDFQFDGVPVSAQNLFYTGTESITFLTSGSTGEPKAIRKILLALTNETGTLASTFPDCINGCTFTASVSHMHIYGLLFNILLPMLYGSGIVPCIIEYQEQLHSLAGHFDDMVFVSSPAFLSRLDTRLPPLSFRKVFSSGGPLSASAASQAGQCFSGMPVEVYGSTETGGIGYRCQEFAGIPWQPFTGVKLVNTIGGTQIKSGNMPGESPYILDDILRLFEDGRFLLEGRKDLVVKIAEKRVSLTEIENFLEECPDIAKCCALLLEGRRTSIACVIVPSEQGLRNLAKKGKAVITSEWRDWLKQRFESVTIPRKWRIKDEIPVNSQGKTDYQSLLSLFEKKDS